MKKLSMIMVAMMILSVAVAQKDSFDIVSFNPPKGWEKKTEKNLVLYTITNQVTKGWCQVGIVRSTVSKGSIESDFDSEWDQLVVRNYNVKEKPQANEVIEAEGWKVKAAGAKFTFNNADAAVLLTTFSGYNRCFSILATTNNQDYLGQVDSFLASLDLQKPSVIPVADASSKQTANTSSTKTGAFAFTTTNFDDGWTSVVKEDWVEVSKGNVKVLLHYPKEGTIIAADPEPVINNAWNILVAPRYSSIKNYKIAPTITEYDRGYLAAAELTEKGSGKQVYVTFFRRVGTGWVEFITPDRNTFLQNFGVDINTITWSSSSDIWNPLMKMTGYNKFAVGSGDFAGVWTSDFTGMQQLYSVYTGQYMGMNLHQSNETFEINKDNTYSWKLLVVSGMVGSAKYTGVDSKGKFSVVNNWQVNFSDIEGKPKTYNAYFSCIKGARILWLQDAVYPGGGPTGYGKKK